MENSVEIGRAENKVEPRRRGPNKRSSEFREILQKIRFDIPREAAKLYPSLSPMMKFKMLEFLTSYCYPKLYAQIVDDGPEIPPIVIESTDTLLNRVDAVAEAEGNGSANS